MPSCTYSTGEWQATTQWRWIDAEVRLEVNLHTGEFTIDRRLPTSLPESIRRHPSFVRVFGSWNPEACPIRGRYHTKVDTGDGTFVFTEGDDLTIEQTVDGVRYRYVPPAAAPQPYPHWFTSTAFHWTVLTAPVTQYRSVALGPASTSHEFRAGERVVSTKGETTGLTLMPTTSQAHQVNASRLPIDEATYIHVYGLGARQASMTIVLARYGLTFTEQLHCTKLSGTVMSNGNAVLGCLNGLKRKILIDPDDSGPAVLVVPVASVSNRTLTLPDTPTQAVFRYSVDPTLRRLTHDGTIDGWVYLTLLHAAFARPTAEPLLGVPGSHVALSMLQSVCIPSQGFSQRALTALTEIAALSPTRSSRPKNVNAIEQIKWPPGLDPVCACDLYGIIAAWLDHRSKTIVSPNDANPRPAPSPLAVRGYLDSMSLYPPLLGPFDDLPRLTVGALTRPPPSWPSPTGSTGPCGSTQTPS